jgi:hypothetical protein
MYKASEYGAMLFPSQYTAFGWGAHRLGPVAEYLSGGYSLLNTKSIASTGACILARDPNAGIVNNQIPTNSILFENDVSFLNL